MGTIHDCMNAFNAIDMQHEINVALDEVSEDYLNLNKAQLQLGQTNKNEKITPEYWFENYARIKNEMNPKPGKGTPDLCLTGDFYKGFTLSIAGDKFTVNSTDYKSDDLEYKYGSDIFGLNEENLKKFINEVFRPCMFANILEKMKNA